MFKLFINNFRSFQNEEFDFSRINILIGENSSGKSSLLKFLLALKQSLESPNSREYNFTFRGEYVDLGNYKEAIYYNQDDKFLNFKFTFDEKYYSYFPLTFHDEDATLIENQQKIKKVVDIIGDVRSDTSVEYIITKELNKHETIQTYFENEKIGNLRIIHFPNENKKEGKVFENPTCSLVYNDFKNNLSFELSDIEYEKFGFMSLIMGWALRNAIKKHIGIPPEYFDATIDDDELKEEIKYLIKESDRIFHQMAFLLVSQNYLRYRMTKLDFINPINTKPSRFYINRDEKKNSIIKDIEDVVDFLSRNNDLSKTSFKNLNSILQKFGLINELELIQDDRLPVKELKVRIKDLTSNIMDVGYGVVLQIPIIFKALLAEQRRESIILIEQPEVHLHPKLHAAFIDTLLSLGTNNIYFIETHSEHLIRKLQIIVKNKSHNITSNDISINYFIRDNEKSKNTKHKITEGGILEPSFPSGFFDNSYMLSLNLLT